MDSHIKSSADTIGSSGKGAFSHAYIIWGGSETEQQDAARKLAAALVCAGTGHRPCMECAHCDKAFRGIHPDIIALERNPDAREIYVDQVRALREDAFIMPNEAAKKVYIIRHAGSMNLFAQNAILKLLEEPPPSAAFILVAGNPAELLQTVRSRCVELSADKHDMAMPARIRDDAAAFYDALTGSSLKLIELSFSLEKLEKSAFAAFLSDAEALLVSKMKDHFNGTGTAPAPDYMMKAVVVLDRAKEYLDSNVSLGHITGMICAELIQAAGESDRKI